MTDIRELAEQLSGFSPEERENIIKIGMAIQTLPPEKREFIRGGAVILSATEAEKKGA